MRSVRPMLAGGIDAESVEGIAREIVHIVQEGLEELRHEARIRIAGLERGPDHASNLYHRWMELDVECDGRKQVHRVTISRMYPDKADGMEDDLEEIDDATLQAIVHDIHRFA